MIPFKLPSLGADMDEGTLLQWKVKPGDSVRRGQVIAVVDTTKAAVDVESWQEGTVAELLVEPGTTVPVDTVLANFLEPGESLPPSRTEAPAAPAPAARPAAEAAAAAPPATPAATGAESATRHRISPAARVRALAQGIDVETLTGTGPGGAVTLADVSHAVRRLTAESTGTAAGDKAARMRQTIAAAMARSKREIPHYYVAETIPMARALEWLAGQNAERSIEERLLPAVLLLKAVAVALHEFPELNGVYGNGEFHPVPSVHLGVAISLRHGGLIAPALLDAGAKPLGQLMQELADLVLRGRAGSLRSSEMSEPTITVTNLGDEGAQQVFGVIHPPQVALVGFGRISERAWADDGAITVVPAVTASLSADHRVSDGHRGARFLVQLRDLLQHPAELAR